MPYFDIDLNLSWEDQQLKETVHEFARDVMRPIAKELDQMDPKEAVAAGSPIWDFMRQAYGMGFHSAMFPEEMGGGGLTPLQIHILNEELSWGSFGMAATLGVACWPFLTLAQTGNQELIEKYVVPYINCTDGTMVGCWGGTEPNRGSDIISPDLEFYHKPGTRADCTAVLDGDEYVINGSKSAWVSAAPIASHVQMHIQLDDSMGLGGNGVAFMPIDLPGLTKGAALDKMGLRDLSQGELFFDNVRIPKSHMLCGTDQGTFWFDQALSKGNMSMAVWSTGLARAAYDEALAYAKERVQGGKPIIEHDSMKIRLHQMFSRVEACRSFSRSVLNLNATVYPGHPEYSFAAKTLCTQMALDNASEAIQIHGGYGLTKEYNTEKWFRDARANLIADGANEHLSRRGGDLLAKTYPRVRASEA
jgi:alkylation response protein AidB-like acyl-CoA dehydrogenase